jgi:hypothetical protein
MELKASIATVFRLITVRRFPRVGVFETHAERKVRAMILRGKMAISSLEGRLIHQMEVEGRAWLPAKRRKALVSVRYALGCSGRGNRRGDGYLCCWRDGQVSRAVVSRGM